ncbi:MAG: ABC transporter substrate-binding protein [Candidatus Dormiibacterota bacterium]
MKKVIPKMTLWRLAGLAALAALAMGTLGSGALTASAASSSSSSKIVTWAEAPDGAPNYLAPMESATYFTTTNAQYFSWLTYRPLYWFGDNGKPVINPALSIADPPKYSNDNKTVTITLKHWKWSDGTPITARDVTFWMNLLKASVSSGASNLTSSSAAGPGWGAYVPGLFPDNVTSYTATGTYTVQLQLNAAYNPTWFTYNELSQMFPIPQQSWDKTSASSPDGNYDETVPGTATSGALAVAQYINSESQDTSTYGTNPMWQVVSGPFKISSYNISGYAKFVPNPRYSGPDKADIKAFEEIPFTSDESEFNELKAGDLTIGYMPVADYSQLKELEHSGYDSAYWWVYLTNYFPLDFSNAQAGPLFKQLYIRQAMQSLVNQKQIIKDYYVGGTGSVNNGPVPTYPSNTKDNPFLSKLEANQNGVYPYDPAKADSLLKVHGWKVNKGGTSTCAKPGTGTGECGAGITAGEPLQFTFLYTAGQPAFIDEMTTLVSGWKQQAGIDAIVKTPETFGDVITNAYTPGDAWQADDWNGGWVYSPDYLPTGEELFETGASSNVGGYNSAEANALIKATNVAPTAKAEITAIDKYENYLAQQLPVIWTPNQPNQLTVYSNKLSGLVPQGVFDELYPQDYRVS